MDDDRRGCETLSEAQSTRTSSSCRREKVRARARPASRPPNPRFDHILTSPPPPRGSQVVLSLQQELEYPRSPESSLVEQVRYVGMTVMEYLLM